MFPEVTRFGCDCCFRAGLLQKIIHAGDGEVCEKRVRILGQKNI